MSEDGALLNSYNNKNIRRTTMPGLNQRGPEGTGPMTGRKMGRCTAGSNQNPAYPGQAYGRRGYGQGRGRNCGQGFGRQKNGFAPWAASAGPASPPTKQDLDLRAKALEQELEAVRNELKNFSQETN
jgi:hypothetical protein